MNPFMSFTSSQQATMDKTQLIVPWDPPSTPQAPALVAYSISKATLHTVVDGNIINAYDMEGTYRAYINQAGYGLSSTLA